MPKHKISVTIRGQILDVQARLRKLEEECGQKAKEDYEWFKRFFTDWIVETERWLQLAETA